MILIKYVIATVAISRVFICAAFADTDKLAQYYIMREILPNYLIYDEFTEWDSDRVFLNGGGRGANDILGNGFVGEYTGEDYLDLAELAFSVIRWQNTLRSVGYPIDVWLNAINNFEEYQLNRILSGQGYEHPNLPISYPREMISEPTTASDELFATLLRSLESYRTRFRPDLPEVLFSCGCGDGPYLWLRTIIDPIGGRVQMISDFSFQVCRRIEAIVVDIRSCGGAFEVISGGTGNFGGDYHYQAEWTFSKYRSTAPIQLRDLDLNAWTIIFTPNGVSMRLSEE